MNRTPYIPEDQREAWESSVVENTAPEEAKQTEPATPTEPAQQQASDTQQAQ